MQLESTSTEIHDDDDAVFGSQVETREDEEQSVKLAEILELLLAAGYFRARIKGLSPFDKVHTVMFVLAPPCSEGNSLICAFFVIIT